MGLIKCPDCGRMISDRAIECVGCGRPISNNTTVSNSRVQTSYTPSYQNYNTPQNNYGYQNTPYNQEPDIPSPGLEVLSFLFPILGLILFCVYSARTPIKAGRIGKAALIGFLIGILLIILLGTN